MGREWGKAATRETLFVAMCLISADEASVSGEPGAAVFEWSRLRPGVGM